MTELEIIYQDTYFAAVNKPAGLLSHKSELDPSLENALKCLKNQLGRKVYLVHRLDRATSGVLLFSLDTEALKLISRQFEHKKVQKTYHAVVRGYLKEHEIIGYPLKNDETGVVQEAVTEYRCLARTELPFAVGRYQTSRYSLAEIKPLTGRRHQIRKHFHHIFHPVIGDTTYGEGRHNRFFREKLETGRMLLHASQISFNHPYTDEIIIIKAGFDNQFKKLLQQFGWDL